MEYRVIKVIDLYTVVINAGSEKVDEGDSFNLYGYDENVTVDPETGEELGHLYYPKGKGVIISTQEKMSILRSCTFEDKTKRERKVTNPLDRLRSPWDNSPQVTEYTEKVRKPFDNPEIGDIVK